MMTLNKLFALYPGLNNPRLTGIEFLEVVDKLGCEPDEANDLRVITALEPDEKPGDLTWSGFYPEDGKQYPNAKYVLSFPYKARILIFDSVDDIYSHLMEHEGKFELPGYEY